MDRPDPATGRAVYASNLISWARGKMGVAAGEVREVRYYCIQDQSFTARDRSQMHASEQTDRSADLALLSVGIVGAARRAFPAISRLLLGGPGGGQLDLGIVLK
jgi:hypothetical protein